MFERFNCVTWKRHNCHGKRHKRIYNNCRYTVNEGLGRNNGSSSMWPYIVLSVYLPGRRKASHFPELLFTLLLDKRNLARYRVSSNKRTNFILTWCERSGESRTSGPDVSNKPFCPSIIVHKGRAYRIRIQNILTRIKNIHTYIFHGGLISLHFTHAFFFFFLIFTLPESFEKPFIVH